MMPRNGWIMMAAAVALVLPAASPASQLSGDARSSIPKDVQQLIVVDYRAMQGSPAAMQLKDHVLPPELKRMEKALKDSGLKVDQDADTLAFAAFRTSSTGTNQRILGVAQGQFQTASIMGYFTKNKIKATPLRNNMVYPMGAAGMDVVFLNQTTMIFGDKEAVRAALDARDGLAPNFLQNGDMMNDMNKVDARAMWSLLDQKGTQTMMRSVIGMASQLADYSTVQVSFRSARYTMDFANGVRFNMTVVMGDAMTAATAATVMKGVMMLKKNSGSPLERSALDETTVGSQGSDLVVDYTSSDSQFAGLLTSPLFQQVVR